MTILFPGNLGEDFPSIRFMRREEGKEREAAKIGSSLSLLRFDSRFDMCEKTEDFLLSVGRAGGRDQGQF